MAVDTDIFSGVIFAIISKHVDNIETTKRHLELNGATQRAFDISSLQEITHVISSSSDFDGYISTVNSFVHIVTPAWVTQSISKHKLLNPRQFSPASGSIFSNTYIGLASDIPASDSDAIALGVKSFGGQVASGISRSTTHLITLSTQTREYALIHEKSLSCVPVLPHWFEDCLARGKLIDVAPYTLPDAGILRGRGKSKPRVSEIPSSYEAADDLSDAESITQDTTTGQLLSGCNVFLSHDLEVGERLRSSLGKAIQNAGGKIVSKLAVAHTLICQYRESEDFKFAIERKKKIGNLSWLFYILRHQWMTNPTTILTHYPIPRNGVAGFQNLRIAVSNYSGDARTYLETLITALGGLYTKTLSEDNTHLITAHKTSDKVQAAFEWSIMVVNHLWLEESYAKQKAQDNTASKYLDFTDEDQVVPIGQTTIVTDNSLQSLPIHSNEHEETTHTAIDNSSDDAESDEDFEIAPERRISLPRSISDKENTRPGGRAAKNRALNKVHVMAEDMNLFQKECKRSGGVVYGGRKSGDLVVAKKRKSTELTDDDNEEQTETDDGTSPHPKKARVVRKARVLITGGNQFGWTESKTKKIKELGMRVVSGMPTTKVDAVVAPKALRTFKFLGAIALGEKIIKNQWLNECLRRNECVSTDGWELEGSFETSEGQISLAEAQKRARVHNTDGGMMRGMTVYCTETVQTEAKQFRKLVNRLGGAFATFTGEETRLSASKNPHWPGVVFLIASLDDETVWDEFLKLAEANSYEARVVDESWIINVALTQDPTIWQDDWLLTSSDW